MTVGALRLPPGPRAGDNMAGSFTLALAMHALLFGAMTLAVQWRTQPSAPVVAELWSTLPALPEPVPQVAPPPPPPAPKVEAEPEKPADIVIKQEKKEEKKPEPPRKEEKKPEPKPEPKKAEPKKAEPVKKAEEKPRPQTDLERILAQAGSTAPAAAGAPAGASGVRGSDSGYSARVIGCIRPHIRFVVPDGTPASVYAEFRIELLPDASVAGVRLARASGLPGYDDAAERAIRRCDPFPRKSDGTLDRSIVVQMYPVEPR